MGDLARCRVDHQVLDLAKLVALARPDGRVQHVLGLRERGLHALTRLRVGIRRRRFLQRFCDTCVPGAGGRLFGVHGPGGAFLEQLLGSGFLLILLRATRLRTLRGRLLGPGGAIIALLDQGAGARQADGKRQGKSGLVHRTPHWFDCKGTDTARSCNGRTRGSASGAGREIFRAPRCGTRPLRNLLVLLMFYLLALPVCGGPPMTAGSLKNGGERERPDHAARVTVDRDGP